MQSKDVKVIARRVLYKRVKVIVLIFSFSPEVELLLEFITIIVKKHVEKGR